VSAGDQTPTPRGSDRPALVVAALALAAVVVFSTIVGFVGAPHGERFSWELASIFGTALGTTLLAASTGWLAWSTRSEVRATQDLAELTRRQQAASERPVVLLKRNASWSGSLPNGVVSCELHNVGLAPALRVNVSANYTGHLDWQPGIDSVTIPVIEAGTAFAETMTTSPGLDFSIPAVAADVGKAGIGGARKALARRTTRGPAGPRSRSGDGRWGGRSAPR
jgi:hypothetical protein